MCCDFDHGDYTLKLFLTQTAIKDPAAPDTCHTTLFLMALLKQGSGCVNLIRVFILTLCEIVCVFVFHLFPYSFIPLYSHLCPTPPQPALLCFLLGNTCHSILPQLTRLTPGRTQASPDVKPLLPFHLLPHFTDVSTVSLHL